MGYWLIGIYTIPILLLMGTLLLDAYEKYYQLAKLISSAAFMGVAYFVALRSNHLPQLIQMAPALIFCFIGDLALGYYHHHGAQKYFLVGLGSFLLGHLSFVVAFSQLQALQGVDFVIPVASLFLTVGLTKLKGMHLGSLKPVVYVYTFFVGLMFAKSMHLALFIPSLSTLLLCIGSGLFLISDSIILFLYFYDKKHVLVHPLNLITYYYGMFLIAISLG